MKKILLILLVIGTTQVFSQDADIPVVNKFLKFGFKGGLNFNSSGDVTQIVSDFSGIDDAKEQVSGFYVGVYTELKLLMLYLRPELHFTKYDTNFDNITVGQSRIEAPVSLGLKVLPILSGFAGPTFRYQLAGDDSDYSIENVTSNATLGVHFGVRLHLGKLGIDVRYDRGISEQESTLLSSNNVNIGKIDNRPNLLSLGLSYAF